MWSVSAPPNSIGCLNDMANCVPEDAKVALELIIAQMDAKTLR
jgi:hypothetical protein